MGLSCEVLHMDSFCCSFLTAPFLSHFVYPWQVFVTTKLHAQLSHVFAEQPWPEGSDLDQGKSVRRVGREELLPAGGRCPGKGEYFLVAVGHEQSLEKTHRFTFRLSAGWSTAVACWCCWGASPQGTAVRRQGQGFGVGQMLSFRGFLFSGIVTLGKVNLHNILLLSIKLYPAPQGCWRMRK